jgi:hypothetical protein
MDDCEITLLVAYVSKTFKQVNNHKAVGSDRLPGRVLKACTDQLASVFTDIFNLSLTESNTYMFRLISVVIRRRQQHICYADPQHWGPTGVCA